LTDFFMNPPHLCKGPFQLHCAHSFRQWPQSGPVHHIYED
jgi:hypothetical protein